MPAPNTISKIMGRLIVQENGCCLWPGQKLKGYGRVKYHQRAYPVHRLLYEHFVGPVPAGLVLDHLCRNLACGNFAHLEAVTQRVNVLRGEGIAAKEARQTHCKRGHPLSGDNLYVGPTTGKRQCQQCTRERHAELWPQARERRRQRVALRREVKRAGVQEDG